MRRFFHHLGRGLIALAAFVSAGLAPSAQAAGWSANADDALLLDVRLNQYRMGDGVRGYQTSGGVCVDLADTILALDVAVRLDKQSRRATGWAYDERQTLTIDRVSGEEQIKNQRRKVAPDDIYDTPEGWCVSTVALSRWFGVTLEADTSNALLVIKSERKLPPQLAAERRQRVAAVVPVFDLASLPQSRTPHRGIKAPAINVVASVNGVRDKISGNRVDVQYELYAAGEAGPVAYDARLSSDRSGLPQSLRVRAYRTDPAGGLLGPLNATHVAVGDVQGLSSPLVSLSGVGRGFVITNRPVDRPLTFDRTDFRGELPRGWDAELYRNGQLLAFANDRMDGRYEFLDVPLQYGANNFEVVLYGPQGQIRRETKMVPVGVESIPPRKTWYWASADEEGEDLISLDRAPSYGRRGWRGSFGLERGLDTKTSFALSAHSLLIDGAGRRNFGEVALRRSIGPALAEFSTAFDASGGYAARGQALAQLGRTNFSFETIWAGGDFRSDRIARGIVGLHTVSVDQFIGNGRTSVPIHFDARYTQRTGGDASLELNGRSSLSLGRMSVTGELTYRAEHRNIGPDPPGQVEGGLLANARIGRIRLRGEGRWRIAPETEFQSATIVGEWNAGRDLVHPAQWRAELGYDQRLGRARAGLGYIRRFDKALVSANGEVASDGSVAAGLSLAFSIGPDPRRQGGIRVTSDKLASQGSALVRVYRDTNMNGVWDPGERFEKGAQVTAGRAAVESLTDVNGEVVIDGLEPYQGQLIGIDGLSLPDPLVQPSLPGKVVTPRPGVVSLVELPLVATGDIDGTLVRAGGGRLEGIDLELVDVENRVLARTRTDFDGFFLFENVPYGRYSLRVAKLVADATKLTSELNTSVTIAEKAPSVHLGAVTAYRPGETVQTAQARASEDVVSDATPAAPPVEPVVQAPKSPAPARSVRSGVSQHKSSPGRFESDKLVRSRRLELPRPFGHNDLNVARLPVPPRPHSQATADDPAAGRAAPLAKPVAARNASFAARGKGFCRAKWQYRGRPHKHWVCKPVWNHAPRRVWSSAHSHYHVLIWSPKHRHYHRRWRGGRLVTWAARPKS